jgi:ATP-dependent DNA helicase RecQ
MSWKDSLMANQPYNLKNDHLRSKDIEILVHSVDDQSAKQKFILEKFGDGSFDPKHSRAIIFVTSRRKAEELAETITAGLDGQLEALPFHAGLTAEERLKIYEQYCDPDGGLSVLCATKAFGMGMDIDNIHLVVHYGPPSSLEDYLQEIGRAARNPKALTTAGLSKAQAHLLLEPDDFRRMRERLTKDFLNQNALQSLLDLIKQTRDEQHIPPNEVIPIEMDRMGTLLDLSKNQVHLGLYWLERLGRLQTGCYTLAGLEIEINRPQAEATLPALSGAALHLLKAILEMPARENGKYVTARTSDLKRAAKVFAADELFRLINKLSSSQVINLNRKLLLPLVDARYAEMYAGLKTARWPLLNTTLSAAQKIFGRVPQNEKPLITTRKSLTGIFTDIANEELKEDDFTWITDPQKRRDQFQKEKNYFPRRIHILLNFLRGLGLLEMDQKPEPEGMVYQLMDAGMKRQPWLESIPAITHDIFRFILQQFQLINKEGDEERALEVDGQELLLLAEKTGEEHNVELGLSQVMAILRLLRDLGYLKRTDSYMPGAIEVIFQREDTINTQDDGLVLKELEEQKGLRLMRLDALQATSKLISAGERELLERFINERYFDLRSQEELADLLGDIPEGGDITRVLREEALKELLDGNPQKEKPGLSAEQRSVYDAPLNRSLLVIAGPGAGKTHTLLARLIRLVHKENVAPNKILVLAFTRAVVSELRGRLRTILRDLGYLRLADQIEVRTFHSFILHTLRMHGLDDSNFEVGTEGFFARFTEAVNSQPTLARTLRNRYQYVFVDEFQDVRDVMDP